VFSKPPICVTGERVVFASYRQDSGDMTFRLELSWPCDDLGIRLCSIRADLFNNCFSSSSDPRCICKQHNNGNAPVEPPITRDDKVSLAKLGDQHPLSPPLANESNMIFHALNAVAAGARRTCDFCFEIHVHVLASYKM
jgi:hypothetical protein